MANVLIGFWLLLIILIAAAFLAYYFFPAAFPVFRRHAHVPNQVVIKRYLKQYHKYLSDHSLIKTVFDETPSLLPPGIGPDPISRPGDKGKSGDDAQPH